MLAEVEAALAGTTLSGLVKQVMPISVEVQMDSIQDRPVGIATLAFIVTYFTTGANPAVSV
jgi:hypothetical protein